MGRFSYPLTEVTIEMTHGSEAHASYRCARPALGGVTSPRARVSGPVWLHGSDALQSERPFRAEMVGLRELVLNLPPVRTRGVLVFLDVAFDLRKQAWVPIAQAADVHCSTEDPRGIPNRSKLCWDSLC
jgi:hypothetical protein